MRQSAISAPMKVPLVSRAMEPSSMRGASSLQSTENCMPSAMLSRTASPGVASHVQRDPHVGGSDAVENHGANVVWVLARIDDRGASAVRAAVEVDLRVAEKLPHVVEIVHGDRCRIVANIGFVWILGQAG